MSADFYVISVGRFYLNDEKLCRCLHYGVRKFSRQGMVKTGEWGEFGNHAEKKERY